jgi:ribosomal protein L32
VLLWLWLAACVQHRLVERFFPSCGELAPALDSTGPLDQQCADDDGGGGSGDNTSIWNFAVPKKKVSHSIRRLRQTHKWMKPDQSVYQCPVCKAFKKRHIAMHCARAEDICGLGEWRLAVHDAHPCRRRHLALGGGCIADFVLRCLCTLFPGIDRTAFL